MSKCLYHHPFTILLLFILVDYLKLMFIWCVQAEKLVILKAVGVIEASSNVVFEMLMDTKNTYRKG